MSITPEIAEKADLLRGQILNMHDLAIAAGSDVEAATRRYFDMLQKLYADDLPLSRLLADSDLLVHAEGPAVRDATPSLAAFNWLSGTAESAIRKLSGALFDLLDRDAKRLGKALDLRLTGMASGSLYLGFALAPPGLDLITTSDEPVFVRVRDVVRNLPRATTAIGQHDVLPIMREIIPDAAERDAALFALHRMAPTGHRGIHTVEMATPGIARGSLSQRERVVLTDALRNPLLGNRKTGTFVGQVRQSDMDKNRIQLRDVTGIGTLRCALPPLTPAENKALYGEFVRVTGTYETDRNGRPRLMLVERVEPLPRAEQPLLA